MIKLKIKGWSREKLSRYTVDGCEEVADNSNSHEAQQFKNARNSSTCIEM